MVLLKNEKQTLPIAKGAKVALFGKATIDYVKGGGGSGDVTVAYTKSLYDGMKEKEDEGKLAIFPDTIQFYKDDVEKQHKAGYDPGMTKEPALPADGPAGLRIMPEVGVVTTAWPCATMLACSFNVEIAESIGAAVAEEIKENNIGIWLAPAINIHRSPLCGRNFEYYSEDAFVAGKIGCAVVRGVQSRSIAATVKRFAFNNKETNRKYSDFRVSERAAREIYLKAFEMIVKDAAPWCIMTSYNKVNGIQCSENKELINGILREEWGFDGLVMSDWWTSGEHYLEAKAGNDLKMGNGYPELVQEAYEKGEITKEEIQVSAKHVLKLILRME